MTSMSEVAFLDCEFTSLESPLLLSMGMVTLSGRQFYCEYDLQCEHGSQLVRRAGDFVHSTVLPMFTVVAGAAVATPEQFALRLLSWIEELPAPVHVGYDYGVDFGLLEDVLLKAGVWERVNRSLVPMHLGYLWGAYDCEEAAQKVWADMEMRSGLRRHHALSDAMALRAAYLAMHG